jgi:DNA (cytosine-5)-methyltransferase 1
VISAVRDLGLRASPQLAVDIDIAALATYSRNLHPIRTLGVSVTDLVTFEIRRGDTDWFFADQPQLTCAISNLEGQIDLVVGGPPCQGHSNFNNATRKTDARNGLYFSAVALAVALRPHAILFENVPEVRVSRSRVVDVAKSLLVSSGYFVKDFILAATDLGWPQTRKRHFILASRTDISPGSDLGFVYGGPHPTASSFLARLPQRPKPAILNTIPEFNEDTKARLAFYEENETIYDLPLHLRPPCHAGGTTYESVYGRIRPDGPFPTITTGFLTPGRGRFVHPCELRTLTPSEAAFVQGFPAWYDFGDDRELNKSMLSKWIGDAVPLPLGYVAAMAVLPGMLGKSLEEVAGVPAA